MSISERKSPEKFARVFGREAKPEKERFLKQVLSSFRWSEAVA
jgi:hypothetical protein